MHDIVPTTLLMFHQTVADRDTINDDERVPMNSGHSTIEIVLSAYFG